MNKTATAADRERARVIRPPEGLAGVALEEWQRVAGPLYDRGDLLAIDRLALRIYCSMYASYRRVCDQLEAATDPQLRAILEDIKAETKPQLRQCAQMFFLELYE